MYTECSEEDAIYIPRKFRKDNTHYKSEDEKRIYDKLNYDRMKSEMEVLKIRRDNFSNELKEEDTDNKKYFENNIPDKDVLKGVLEIWNKSIKRDEEQVQEKWVHKIESVKKDFQRDKEFCKRKKYGDNITIHENRITEREPIHKENNYKMLFKDVHKENNYKMLFKDVHKENNYKMLFKDVHKENNYKMLFKDVHKENNYKMLFKDVHKENNYKMNLKMYIKRINKMLFKDVHKENNYNMNTTETKEQRNPNEKNWNRQTYPDRVKEKLQPKIINVSSVSLTRYQIKILAHGTKFTPTTKGDYFDAKKMHRGLYKKTKAEIHTSQFREYGHIVIPQQIN